MCVAQVHPSKICVLWWGTQGVLFLVIADASGAPPLCHACCSDATHVKSIRLLVAQAPETILQTDNAGNLPIFVPSSHHPYTLSSTFTKQNYFYHDLEPPASLAFPSGCSGVGELRDVVFYLQRADPGFVLQLTGHLP